MKKSVCVLFYMFCVACLFSQVEQNSDSGEKNSIAGFDNLFIGMDYQSALEALDSSDNFIYNSQMPMWINDNPVIAANGKGFVDKGYFQFYNGILYSITIELNKNRIDFFTMFMQLQAKYGKYKSFSPTIVRWEDENALLSLERPLTLRYLEKATHSQLLESSKTKKSQAQKKREDFLEQF